MLVELGAVPVSTPGPAPVGGIVNLGDSDASSRETQPNQAETQAAQTGIGIYLPGGVGGHVTDALEEGGRRSSQLWRPRGRVHTGSSNSLKRRRGGCRILCVRRRNRFRPASQPVGPCA